MSTEDPTQQPPPSGGGHLHGFGGSPECQLCPICVVLQALGSARPDVTQHLLTAAREVAIAIRAAADGQVEATDRAQAAMNDRLTKINID